MSIIKNRTRGERNFFRSSDDKQKNVLKGNKAKFPKDKTRLVVKKKAWSHHVFYMLHVVTKVFLKSHLRNE